MMRLQKFASMAPMGILAIALIYNVALATTITLNPIDTNIPGSASGDTVQSTVQNLYGFALMIAGVLAFGVIVYGGIKYAAGRGNPSEESDAKSWITGALIGLLLLAGAYIVLKTVHPAIVSLNIPGVPSIQGTQ